MLRRRTEHVIAVALATAALPACLPIPVKKTYVTWPGGTVRVVDAETGAPLPSAAIVVTRIVHPYSQHEAERRATADATGAASFTGETEVKTVYPLMMHGVPQHTFEVCADAPGHAARTERWENEGGALTVKLRAGSRPCDAKVEQTPPKPGTARIEGVENESGDTWFVQLAIRAEEPVRAGDALIDAAGAKAEITKVEYQLDAQPGLKRARVKARGAGGLSFGQVVARG